jgi:hypothetical protein
LLQAAAAGVDMQLDAARPIATAPLATSRIMRSLSVDFVWSGMLRNSPVLVLVPLLVG